MIERDGDVSELMGILTSEDQRHLSKGFVVAEHGVYLGLGTGEQLVRAVTETRIEAARHANPLIFLPGNIPISVHIERLPASGIGFVAGYADLNDFKPFNDPTVTGAVIKSFARSHDCWSPTATCACFLSGMLAATTSSCCFRGPIGK